MLGVLPTARLQRLSASATAPSHVQTVTGPVRPEALGVTLMHEHLLVDFIGAAQVSRSRYDPDAVFTVALPHLQKVRQLGCETLVDCTPAYLGRDPQLLKRLSEASGVRIVTNTGFYGAANDKHVPAFAFEETAEQLAARWIREAVDGIEDTSIRPGLLKIGVDGAPLSDIDAKLVRAAALTTLKTGLPIASHTGSGRRQWPNWICSRPRAWRRRRSSGCTHNQNATKRFTFEPPGSARGSNSTVSVHRPWTVMWRSCCR
jgi:Phosphotriesterase family